MTDKQLQEINKLKELAMPLQRYMLENNHPYCMVIVSYDNVKLVETKIAVPLPVEW